MISDLMLLGDVGRIWLVCWSWEGCVCVVCEGLGVCALVLRAVSPVFEAGDCGVG